MSPRRQTVPDGTILEATGRVIGRLGPSRFTLADVAGEVGLSAATLVQRFGSKRGLMLALAESASQGMDACFADIRARHRSPLEALLVAATEMARHVESPETLANQLAFLQIDLSDPDFRALALESSRAVRAGYRALLEEAVRAGELRPCDPERLAAAVEALSGGSLIAWAIHRRGAPERFVRRDVETLLAPLRREADASRRAGAARRSRRTDARGETAGRSRSTPKPRRRNQKA